MNLQWMPLYIGDYLRDTAHITAAESGAYLHLLMNLWLLGNLPNNDRQLARIAKMTDKEWRKSRDTISAFFGEGWSHRRLEDERAVAQQKYTKKVEAGAAGGRAKARNAARGRLEGRQTPSSASSNTSSEMPSTATTTANSKTLAEVYLHPTQPQWLLRNQPSQEGRDPSQEEDNCSGVEHPSRTHAHARPADDLDDDAPFRGGDR